MATYYYCLSLASLDQPSAQNGQRFYEQKT
jgi:hypothetical protein